jgi:hypothetical protein
VQIEVGQDRGIARRELVLARALSLVSCVTGEVDLGIAHLDYLNGLIDRHVPKVSADREIRQNESFCCV